MRATILLLLLEIGFAAAFVGGIAVIYWPAALIVGGVLGVAACERADSRSGAR